MDFVTNSSSSSFVIIHVKSKLIADCLRANSDDLQDLAYGWNPVEVNISGSNVDISSGTRDASYVESPQTLEEFLYGIEDLVCTLDELDTDLFDSVQEAKWESTQYGVDGDDGCFDRENSEPDALEMMLESIADYNGCTLEEVCDEMFREYIASQNSEPDVPCVIGTYSYNKREKKSKYYFYNRLSVREGEFDESVPLNERPLPAGTEWIKDKIFVLTGFESDEAKYSRVI